jgi:hypothetical protein
MSDWGAQHQGAPGGFGQGGLDQSMPGGSAKNMQALLDGGNMTMADVDETTLRILTPMFRMGLFESVDANGELLNKSRSVHANVTSTEHNSIARQLAAQAMIVLKNKDEVLPLDAETLRTIAVIGTEAGPGCAVHGGVRTYARLLIAKHPQEFCQRCWKPLCRIRLSCAFVLRSFLTIAASQLFAGEWPSVPVLRVRSTVCNPRSFCWGEQLLDGEWWRALCCVQRRQGP